jgi:ribosomal protein L20
MEMETLIRRNMKGLKSPPSIEKKRREREFRNMWILKVEIIKYDES